MSGTCFPEGISPSGIMVSVLAEDALDILHGVLAGDGLGDVGEDRVRVLESVTGADAGDGLVLVDDALFPELLESGDGCGGRGLHADTLPPSFRGGAAP